MVSLQTWTSIAFDLAADDVPPQRVISRSAEIWRQNKSQIKTLNEPEARQFGRQTL